MKKFSIMLIATIFLVVVGATGCKAEQVNITFPSNIPSLQATAIGTALKAYDYTPVIVLFGKDKKPDGYVYIACGSTNLLKCAKDVHNRGSFERPNVYVVNDKVLQLEGPHDGNDDRTYWCLVPADWQDFASMTPDRQSKLLGVVKEISGLVDNSLMATGDPETVYSPTLGETTTAGIKRW